MWLERVVIAGHRAGRLREVDTRACCGVSMFLSRRPLRRPPGPARPGREVETLCCCGVQSERCMRVRTPRKRGESS